MAQLCPYFMETAQKFIGHPKTDPKPYAKYQNPHSRGSQVIVLTRFFLKLQWQESKKERNPVNISLLKS